MRSARAAGTLRMGTVDSFLCDRLGAGFATDPSTASRTQLQRIDRHGSFDERLCEIFGVPLRRAARDPRQRRASSATLRHEQLAGGAAAARQTVDQQAALAGAGCVEPGRVKATYGTGVFVLAHVGDGVRAAPAGCCRRSRGASTASIEYALDGGVFAAGAMLEWMCKELGIADDPPALSELAREARDLGRAPACCRRSRGSARRGGGPTRGR